MAYIKYSNFLCSETNNEILSKIFLLLTLSPKNNLTANNIVIVGRLTPFKMYVGILRTTVLAISQIFVFVSYTTLWNRGLWFCAYVCNTRKETKKMISIKSHSVRLFMHVFKQSKKCRSHLSSTISFGMIQIGIYHHFLLHSGSKL